MPKTQIEEILDFTKKGATLEMIAKHYKISTRTLSRKLKDYKKEMEIARSFYQSFLEGIFKA